MKIQGSAVNGGTHQDRVDLPRPTSGSVRPAHREVQAKPRGLDWTALKPTCRGCGTKTSDLNRDDQCTNCAPRAVTPVPAAAPRPRGSARTKGRRARRGPAKPKVPREPKPRAQYPRPIGPRRRPGRPTIERGGRPIRPRTSNGPERIPLDGPAIAAAYAAGRTLRELADEHQVSAPTIARALDDQGVVRRKQRIDYTPDLIERIRALYVDEHLDQQQVADRLDITTKVVQTAMARGGITPRESASARSQRGIGHPIKITPDIAEEILTRYRAGEAGPQIAAAYDVSAASIYHLLTKHGVPRHGRRTPGLGRDGSIGLKARITELGVTAREINQWALEAGLMDLPKPGLPSAATVDAWEDAHTEVAS